MIYFAHSLWHKFSFCNRFLDVDDVANAVLVVTGSGQLLPGPVDLVSCYNLTIRPDLVLFTKLENLFVCWNTTNYTSSDGLSLKNKRNLANRMWLLDKSKLNENAFHVEQRKICVKVVLSADSVEDQVTHACVRLHRLWVIGDTEVGRSFLSSHRLFGD